MNEPGPATAVAGVIGYPVKHSLSPRLHNAAYRQMGLGWCYLAFEVPPGSAEKAIVGAAALGLRGLSVTMPHKEAAARVATRHSRQVRRLGAANTLVFDHGVIRAENCDGPGLLDDLRAAEGFDPAGRRCGVIGAGAAARASLLALAEAGAAEIVVVNRTSVHAWKAVTLAPRIARVGRPEELRDLDLVIQATPAQMTPLEAPPEASAQESQPIGYDTRSASAQVGGSQGSHDTRHQGHGSAPWQRASGAAPDETPAVSAGDPGHMDQPNGHGSAEALAGTRGSGASEPGPRASVLGVDPAWFGEGQLVVDIVYNPLRTPFLLEAERSGARVRGGLGMLVHQAARQIRLFTGREAPLGAMWAAVLPEAAAGDSDALFSDQVARSRVPLE